MLTSAALVDVTEETSVEAGPSQCLYRRVNKRHE